MGRCLGRREAAERRVPAGATRATCAGTRSEAPAEEPQVPLLSVALGLGEVCEKVSDHQNC